MNIVVQGSKDFDDYQVFLRAIGVAMSSIGIDDKELHIYSAGPARINSMVSEFCNLSERGMKARGMKIKHYKVPPSWVIENIDYINYFAFLSKPKEAVSKLVSVAESKQIEVGIFRY
jgi:hypothetical protein